jgi:hypothetical protein
MRRFSILLLAGSMTATPIAWPSTSHADDGQVAAGIIGGLAAGALLGAAASQQPAPVYVVPPPPPPRCYLTRGQPVWDEFRGVWIRPRVQVCDPGVVDDEW